ncbi:flagellar biosynthetic protein FliO [Halotalea alkalilenta]|uniref:flagellar biosynthetic protein FliO n=1 Tax=Halotalea alkalilenta TaxID=376489 RepID=UPI000694AE50|nr:flagellar biosynthetic protein FliO [Halotalea alkalilenta]
MSETISIAANDNSTAHVEQPVSDYGQIGAGVADPLVGAGKTALALVVVIALILVVCAALKRFSPQRPRGGSALKVIASQPVGQRERVVLVEVDDTWLVLGVGAGRVEKLHSLPAKRDLHDAPSAPGGFARVLAHARGHKGGRDG